MAINKGQVTPITGDTVRPVTEELHSSLADDFSLTRGGPLYRLEVRLGAADEKHARILARGLVGPLVTWLPLLILSMAQGQAYNTHLRIPFLHDFAVDVRFLIALPILMIAETGVSGGLRSAVAHFLKSGLVKQTDLPSFEAIIQGIVRLRDRSLPELLMLIAALLPSFSAKSMELLTNDVSTWHALPAGAGSSLSYAGWWFGFVSVPIFRFLLLRWLWRIFVWAYFLAQVCRLDLDLVPTHADQAAGLGFLAEAQRRFVPIAFAGGSVISAQIGSAIAFEGATVGGMKFVMIGYCAFAMILLTAPLLVVAPKLIKARKEGLLEYSALESRYGHLFAAKWIHGVPPLNEPLLGSSDIQSLADMGNSFVFLRSMLPIPIDKRTLIGLATAAALPLVPTLILATPTDELIRTLFRFLA
jgi:hypothetical protein